MPSSRVLLYDATQIGKGSRQLSLIWAVSGRFVGGFDHRIAAVSWSQAIRAIEEIRSESKISQVQFWGHGSPARPMVNGQGLSPAAMTDLSGVGQFDPDAIVWFRGCEVFEGRYGQRFAQESAAALKCKVVGHTRVVSGNEKGIPSLRTVFWQSGCYGLRPGETPHWLESDHGGSGRKEPNTVSIFAKDPPAFVWQYR